MPEQDVIRCGPVFIRLDAPLVVVVRLDEVLHVGIAMRDGRRRARVLMPRCDGGIRGVERHDRVIADLMPSGITRRLETRREIEIPEERVLRDEDLCGTSWTHCGWA